MSDAVVKRAPKAKKPAAVMEEPVAQQPPPVQPISPAPRAGGRTVEQIFRDRMGLPGGTTPREAGAEVVMVHERGELGPTDPGGMTPERRRERIGFWTQRFLEWIGEQGKDIRSAGGALIGVGDRIEVNPTGHYRYKW